MTIHPAAAREARAARRWYSERSPAVGARFLLDLRHAFAAVAEAPTRWPPYLIDTRRYPLHRFPYAVIYRVTPDGEARVLAVAHDRRRPGYWQTR